MDDSTNVKDLNLSRLQELVMDREVWRAAVCGVERAEHDWATELNWIKLMTLTQFLLLWNQILANPLFLSTLSLWWN